MVSVRHFVPLDDIQRIGETLAAQARLCGDKPGADAIMLYLEEIQNAVATTLFELPSPPESNGDHR